MNSPCHIVNAMNAAMPAPWPFAWYAAATPAHARSAAAASGSAAMIGGSCATSMMTSSGCAATSARAVIAPPLLPNSSTGPAPSEAMSAWTSPACASGSLSTRPSWRTLRPSPRGS